MLEYTRRSPPEELEALCAQADFVFHLAGVNRPEREEDFITGNRDATAALLSCLERRGRPCPVLLASSIQAVRDNPYGRSKRAAEDLLRAYGGTDRFPGPDIPAAQPLRQMVPAQLQQCGGHLLP